MILAASAVPPYHEGMPADLLPLVLDETGLPRVVWRGESSGVLFEAFDPSLTRAGSGFFFAEDRQQADWYAASGTSARPFHLRANRILDLRDPGAHARDPKFQSFVQDYTSLFDEWVDRFSGELTDPLVLIEAGLLYDYEGDGRGDRWNALFRCAANHGFDAVVTNDATDGSTQPIWVVFQPEQIEWASLECDARPPRRPRCG